MLKASDTSRSHLTNLYILLFLILSLLKGTSDSVAPRWSGSHCYVRTVKNLHLLFRRGVHLCEKNAW